MIQKSHTTRVAVFYNSIICRVIPGDDKQQEFRKEGKMTKQLCPVCGCAIVGAGYEKEGVKYCCEPCATGSGTCQCGCCHPVEEKKEEH